MKIAKIKLIFDRRHTASKSKEGSVEIRIAYASKQKIIATGVKVFPSQWDEKTSVVKFRPDAVALNNQLRKLVDACYEMLDGMATDGVVDLSRLSRVTEVKAYDITFTEYIKQRIPKRIVKESTRKRYLTFYKTFCEWEGMRNFSDITEANIRAFDEWLHNKDIGGGRTLEQSTIAFYHKSLKIFINDAIVDEYITTNPYLAKRIHIDRGDGGQIACLNVEQVSKIEQLVLNGYLDRVRDLFLFQCYTGLAYSDLMKFKLADCEQEEDGSYRLNGRRTKTDTEYTLYLTDKAIAITTKYDGELPAISNQKYNQYLKVIGQMIGEPNLHSHMGRSTFASTMLNNGVSTDIIKHALGHTTTLQTNRYATMRDKTMKEAFKKMK